MPLRSSTGSFKDRESIKAAFQASPADSPVRILLATDAASEGVNLQNHCWQLIHYEIPWNPNRMEQRNGRVDRFGQRNPEVHIRRIEGGGHPRKPRQGGPGHRRAGRGSHARSPSHARHLPRSDPLLRAYSALILDEAHERSLNIDFLLGYLQGLLRKRGDLKLIIMSATIDTEAFSKAFDGAPIVEVSGRLWPVEIRYGPIESHARHDEDAASRRQCVRCST